MNPSHTNHTGQQPATAPARGPAGGTRVKECVTSLRRRHGKATIHYTLPVCARTGRPGLTLCGRPMAYDHMLVERAHAMPAGICPRCRMLKERMDRQMLDPGTPSTFTAFAIVIQDMIELQRMTVPEMAEKAGISQRTLNTEARTGIISMTHLDRLLQAQGHGWSALLADISDLCRRGQRYITIIETIRSKETADE